MYSPAVAKVTFVVVLPPSVAVTAGLALSKVTGPGPRNRLQLANAGDEPREPSPEPPRPAVLGTMRSALATFSFAGSSVTHAVTGSGPGSVTSSDSAMPCGGPVNDGPFGWNLTTGGVFFDAESSSGSSTHSGSVCRVMVLVCPLATSVQVSFLLPKSFGT